ncbi:hypothetical protein HYDPIDRAFT_38074 [Hydnomerulius pinastri MD-312]|nr:hypothetical protein HYDPIDRAFT_38074 [Hydnomerulius pinastri MD-312]
MGEGPTAPRRVQNDTQSISKLQSPPHMDAKVTGEEQNSKETIGAARNVIIFGESGVGKSSLINMITGQNHAATSPDALGCTFRHTKYPAVIDGETYQLWDTAGLDEATMGKVPAPIAEENLKKFLRQLVKAEGIQLLIYCVRGSRATRALLRNYRIFYTAICRRKAPVVVVVTGLENYKGSMDMWWTANEKELKKHRMRFQDHACVTTLAVTESMHPVLRQRCKESYSVVCNLIRKNCQAVQWRTDGETWLKRAFADVRPLMNAKKDGERTAMPNIFVYDNTSQANSITRIAGSITGKWRSLVLEIEEVAYNFHNVVYENQDPGHENLDIHADLLIFYTDNEESASNLKKKLDSFNEHYGKHMCPLILVVRDLLSHQGAKQWWDKAQQETSSSGLGGGMHIIPTYFPASSGGGEAEKRLQELIAEWCFDRVIGAKQQTSATGGFKFFAWRGQNAQTSKDSEGEEDGSGEN